VSLANVVVFTPMLDVPMESNFTKCIKGRSTVMSLDSPGLEGSGPQSTFKAFCRSELKSFCELIKRLEPSPTTKIEKGREQAFINWLNVALRSKSSPDTNKTKT